MANNPKKVKDPTEVALSAIQEALNISDTTVDTSRNSLGNELRADPSAPPAYSELSFDARDTRASAERPVFDPIEEPRSPRRAANDDRETIGQILQAIQKGRPARSVYTLASVFAGVWIVGCALLTFAFLPRCRRRSDRAAACWCSRALRRCSLRRCCCSISSPALPGAARKCG